MLTFRKGTGGAPTAAAAMAEHLREQTMPEDMVAMADYYLRGVKRSDVAGTAAIPRRDMSPAVAAALGIDPMRTAAHDEVVSLLQGRRTNGEEILGRKSYKVGAGRDRITYIDLTFSVPKSVSVAMALAPTEAERHMIVGAHRDAWISAMAHLETIVAHARKGDGGAKGSVRGELGWVSFDHMTARPTVEIPHTEADGTRTTLIQTVRNPKVAGDMQLHTHVTTPNVVVCEDGTVGAMDMLAMHDRVHEVGAYYQAHLATNLRAFGIEVVLDDKTETARLPAIPEAVSELFSKRTRDGEVAAREYVKAQGLDWDAMHPMELAGVLKGGTRATRRQKETGNRGDDMSDVAAWKAQAAAIGYQHVTVIRPNGKVAGPMPQEQERLAQAYDAALPVLERQFTRRATMYASVARTAAARGLIASGVESARDIDRVTAAMREHGVWHDGKRVPLIWAEVESSAESVGIGDRRPRVKITTTLHVEQEREAMALAKAAAADRCQILTTSRIAEAVERVSQRDGLDFTSDHGREQRRIMDALGTSGRFSVAVGVGGAGKTTLLRPLVEAWTNPPDGRPRAVYGTALAWRQSDPLADAGIAPGNAMAIAAFLARAKADQLALNPRTVLIVDELSQVGTAQTLALLRLQKQHGFSIVAIGDDRQAQAIEAGNSIELLRRALGTDTVPELASSVRQLRQRDRDTSLLFRSGQAEEAIGRLRDDGHALLVPGSRRHAVEAVADLWQARTAANVDREAYTLTVSAPTNSDARAISTAIRSRRRAAGDLGTDQVKVSAVDQNGAAYDLPLAVGDRVRLFARTAASFNGKGGNIGLNGSVLVLERIELEGLQLRNAKGSSGFVKWETLRDPVSERVRLAYGDVLTIDAIQSATSTEHINAMVSGSQAVQSFKGYVAQSRSRETTWLVAADGPERSEIMTRRALGNVAPIAEDDVWANVARNLSRQPEKELATDLLDAARKVNVGTIRDLASAFQPQQQRESEGRESTTLYRVLAAHREGRQAALQVAPVQAAAAQASDALRAAMDGLTAPNGETRKAVQAARRAMRPAAARPKTARRRAPMSQTDVQAEFADALHRAGLRPKGAPIMDGQKHRVAVEGDSKGKRSGTYIGHLDGRPAGYIHNFKTGEEVRWSASRVAGGMTPAERAAMRAEADAARTTRDAARGRQEAEVSHLAQALWSNAHPATSHPYLAAKGIEAHGLRQDRRGNLLVPMRDVEGRLWGVQRISEGGGKLFMKDGRKQGTHALLGELAPVGAVIIAEGLATAATLREATGLPTVAAFDSGNLTHVAQAYREQDQARPIVIAGDNDHHLPRRKSPLPNVGQEKAEAAAQAVAGIVLTPPFSPTDKGTDWNDYAAQHGKSALHRLIRAELSRQGIELQDQPIRMPAEAPVITQAQRDQARQAATQTDRSLAQAAALQSPQRARNRPSRSKL